MANNAIVCLTRGYTDPSQYRWIIQRNKAIKQFFGDKYPLLIFHEGNILPIHRNMVDEQSGIKSRWVDISEHWAGGYEGMCQFQAYWLWEYCKDYDYVMRIDEDCFLTKVEVDPFEQIMNIWRSYEIQIDTNTDFGKAQLESIKYIQDKQTAEGIKPHGPFVYLTSVFWAESHSETNATLPQAIHDLTGADIDTFYNNKFPYTNVSVSSVKYWRAPLMSALLKELALSPAQRVNRWGDLPLLGSLLNIDAVGRVGTMKGVEYYHRSHDVNIVCK